MHPATSSRLLMQIVAPTMAGAVDNDALVEFSAASPYALAVSYVAFYLSYISTIRWCTHMTLAVVQVLVLSQAVFFFVSFKIKRADQAEALMKVRVVGVLSCPCPFREQCYVLSSLPLSR